MAPLMAGSHLGFQINRILAIFDLQVILMLPTKFRVNWPLGKKHQAAMAAILDFQSEQF